MYVKLCLRSRERVCECASVPCVLGVCADCVHCEDTLVSGVLQEHLFLSLHQTGVHLLQLVPERTKRSLLLQPQRSQLSLLTDHQLVELGQVGPAHWLHPLVSERGGRGGQGLFR